MDTTSTVRNSSEPVLLILGILKSYEHMGQAVLACESGCTCTPLKFDGHHTVKESVIKQVRNSFIPLPFLSSQDKEMLVFMVIGKSTSGGP